MSGKTLLVQILTQQTDDGAGRDAYLSVIEATGLQGRQQVSDDRSCDERVWNKVRNDPHNIGRIKSDSPWLAATGLFVNQFIAVIGQRDPCKSSCAMRQPAIGLSGTRWAVGAGS